MIQQSQKIRIQNTLISRGKAGKFFAVSYAASGQQTQIDFLADPPVGTVSPASWVCNETSSQFGIDNQYGISRVDKRTTWTFDLLLDFNQEVNAEYFEELLIREPIILPPDKANGLRQVTLRLTRDVVTHPVMQQPSAGTKLRLAFTAEVGRI